MGAPHFIDIPSPIDSVDLDYLDSGVSLYMKRDDLIHPWINGNKWRKLSLNVTLPNGEAPEMLLSFGGAFSNHLVAIAAYGYEMGIPTIGIIRSYDSAVSNPTIQLLEAMHMELYYVLPNDYRLKEGMSLVIELLQQYKNVAVIPEGGTNFQGVEGAKQILGEVYDQSSVEFTHIALGLGTAGTLAGIVNEVQSDTEIIALSPFKGELKDLAGFEFINRDDVSITWKNVSANKRFGSYDEPIVSYINEFWDRYKILLEPVYTSKAMMGIDQMIMEGEIAEGSQVLFIHTGGLQGIMGYNYLHSQKKQIHIPASYNFLHTPLITLGKK